MSAPSAVLNSAVGFHSLVRNLNHREVVVRDGHRRAGVGIADLDNAVELRGQGLNDAGAQARLSDFRVLGHTHAVVDHR